MFEFNLYPSKIVDILRGGKFLLIDLGEKEKKKKIQTYLNVRNKITARAFTLFVSGRSFRRSPITRTIRSLEKVIESWIRYKFTEVRSSATRSSVRRDVRNMRCMTFTRDDVPRLFPDPFCCDILFGATAQPLVAARPHSRTSGRWLPANEAGATSAERPIAKKPSSITTGYLFISLSPSRVQRSMENAITWGVRVVERSRSVDRPFLRTPLRFPSDDHASKDFSVTRCVMSLEKNTCFKKKQLRCCSGTFF